MPKPIVTRDLRIFGDESSHSGDKAFITYGTMACERKDLDRITEKLERASGGPSEIKWRQLRKPNRIRYQRFAEAIFELIHDEKILFHRCVVITKDDSIHRHDIKKGMKDFVFFNLIVYARDHELVPAAFDVTLDEGVPFDTEELRLKLNNRDRDENHWSERFVAIREGESDKDRIIQAADLLTGAIAYANNTDEEAKTWRMDFAKMMARLADIPVPTGSRRHAGIRRGDIATFRVSTVRNLGRVSIFPVDWKFEQVAKYREESAAQLAMLPLGWTFTELLRAGYRFDVMCPRCEHQTRDFFVKRPLQADREVAGYQPPICGACPQPRKPLKQIRGLVFVTAEGVAQARPS